MKKRNEGKRFGRTEETKGVAQKELHKKFTKKSLDKA